jgi:ubiquinone/menaquinone biosynthesis C-methylase UbiE
MGPGGGHVTDYDRVADRFDIRYAHYAYAGVRDTVLTFLGPTPVAALEVGCGTGHWLDAVGARVREADAAAGGELNLVADFRLYATIGWVS